MIYFGVWVSGVLALLLSIFSEVIFPGVHRSLSCVYAINDQGFSFVSLSLENSRSMTPPSPRSRVRGSLCVLSPMDGHDFLCHFGFREFWLLSFGFLWNTFPQSAWISVACPPRSSGSDLLWTPELRRSRSLLVCKFLKCFCCGVSVLSPPVHLALTHGTQSRHLWAYHPLVSK
jgi:hypothetical protein